jgi:helix-turn-helix protein
MMMGARGAATTAPSTGTIGLWVLFLLRAICCAPRTSRTRGTLSRLPWPTWPLPPGCRLPTSAGSSRRPSASHRTRRLERAAALLRATDWSVAAICFAVGAQSLGSFTASFHRVFGLAPLAYRAAYPPAERHLRIPRCVALAYGRPQNRTFREDTAVVSP